MAEKTIPVSWHPEAIARSLDTLKAAADIGTERTTIGSQNAQVIVDLLATKDARIAELEESVSVEIHHEGGGYWAAVTSRPGCASQGDTLPELLRNVAEAIEMWDEAKDATD